MAQAKQPNNEVVTSIFSGKKNKSFSVHCSDDAYELISLVADLEGSGSVSHFLESLIKDKAAEVHAKYLLSKQLGKVFEKDNGSSRSSSFLRAFSVTETTDLH